MKNSRIILSIFLGIAGFTLPLFPQSRVPDILRGEVQVETEPLNAFYVQDNTPPGIQTIRRRALEESAAYFSAMIYGWSFSYDIGERARGIEENFELKPLGSIPFGDPSLVPTEVELRGIYFHLWSDYRLKDSQKRRMMLWRSGTVKTIQGLGSSALGPPKGDDDWFTFKRTALEDAARSAIRAALRSNERNRPKQAHGFISLAQFPLYGLAHGGLAVSARFLLELTEIVPFAAY
ncbi:MAG: hypothetical protein LBQ88_02750 [Treponema sp.]|nr:hypothetical protein [Treponema sp.]